jgi:uncharacterized protein YecE (DUF72 family)
MASYRIGISGWRYPPWRGTFFPKDLAQKDELAYASRQVNSIEINGTFYSLQRPTSFKRWHDATPDDFVFSVKAPRFITHIRRLKDVEIPLANFFASGVLRLGEKLGPVLWQLPPSFRYDADRLAAFFKLLPRDTDEAARIARQHDRAIAEVWLKSERNRPLRHALEVRHASFKTPEFVSLLRQHRIAVVVADTAGKWPLIEDVTADFIYVRLHGDEELYVSGYTPVALKHWERNLRTWHRGANLGAVHRLAAPAPLRAKGRDAFVYFDNDVKIRAPYDAMSLAHNLGIGPKPGTPPSPESIAERPRTPAEWPWRLRRGPAVRKKKTRTRQASAAT